MTEKELKRLNRYQLLELLLLQSERVTELEEQLKEAQKKLDSRQMQMESVGSIAEASVHLSGVFEAAQETADLYMNAVKARAIRVKEETIAEAKKEAEDIIEEARRTAKKVIEMADKKAESR